MVEDLLKLKNFLENGALTLASLIKWAVLPSTKFELLNQFEGEFWVLVNGPSLTKSIESGGDVWKERNTLCVNNFALSELYPRIQPKFYLLHDPFFFVDLDQLKPPSLREDILAMFQAIIHHTSWPMYLLIPYQYKKNIEKYRPELLNAENVKLVYYNYVVMDGWPKVIYPFYRRGKGMVQSQNVGVAALFLGLIMGFKKIYLLGADHSWHKTIYVNQKNLVVVREEHFYDKDEGKEIVMYQDPQEKIPFTMAELFLAWHKVFKGYQNIAKLAQTFDAKIYNATPHSFIDAFERTKLEP